MESGPQEHGAPKRGWLRVLIGFGIVAAVLLLALVVLVVAGFVRESRAIEVVRARGEPLTPAEIAFVGATEKSDLARRVDAFGLALEEAPRSSFYGSDDRAEWLAELRSSPRWAAAIAPAEALLDCLGEDQRGSSELAEAATFALADPVRSRSADDCVRRFVLLKGAIAEPLLELALAACNAAPDTAEGFVRGWKPQDGPGPSLLTTGGLQFTAVRTVVEVAAARALDGRTAESSELFAAAFRGANLQLDWPWLLGAQSRNAARSYALEGLRTALSSLPADSDLSAVERELAAMQPGRELERALVGERAFGNDILASLRDGRLVDDPDRSLRASGLIDALTWSLLGHDRALYLGEMERGIEWSRRSYVDIADELVIYREDRDKSLAWKYSLTARMLLPAMENVIEHSEALRARIALARLALIAHHDGAAAAMLAAPREPDPFSHDTVQARVDADGTLVLWSVGPDLENQGGRDEHLEIEDVYGLGIAPPDIVWRVRVP